MAGVGASGIKTGEHVAQIWARAFYRSKKWEKARGLAYTRDFGLCTKCGRVGEEVHHIIKLTTDNIHDPNVSLNLSNLTTLCRDCHFEIHKQDRIKEKDITRDGLGFDENGNLVVTG